MDVQYTESELHKTPILNVVSTLPPLPPAIKKCKVIPLFPSGIK